jgi:alkyl hydroperoxide reductase subunit F
MYDLIVIGGGPAGLTATIYAIRKRLDVLLLTKDLGGKTNYHLSLPWIEDYQIIRGLEIVNKFRNELEYLEFARQLDAAEKIERKNDYFVVTTKGGTILDAKSIIVATGARQVRMNVPGEKDYTMRGLCYSAVSYAPLFIGRTAIVIGDEELALRSTAELSTVAKHVYLICTGNQALTSPLWMRLQTAANVTILKGHHVLEVKGDQFARRLVTQDPSGTVTEYEADGIFVEKALKPRSEMVKGLVELDEHERIIVDCANRTNVPGLFAAGDVTNGYAEQVLIAVGEGAKATLRAYDYLLPTLTIRPTVSWDELPSSLG